MVVMVSRVDERRQRRPGLALACLVVVLALVGSGCRDNAGDPGNRRLHALQADPALKLVPPGLRFFRQGSLAARKPPFSDLYDGPGVAKSFRFTGPVEQALPKVLEFYSAELPRLGWVFVRKESFPPDPGLTVPSVNVIYTKLFGDWEATLSVRLGRSSTKPRGPEEPAFFVDLDADAVR